ncbi:MAG: hypothetical protein WBO45_13585, partial [Planctomycetota bacterium]
SEGSPAAARAADFAAAASHGALFVDALERTIAAGQLQVAINGATLQAMRWDRAAGQLFVADPTKKPLKETPVPTAAFSPEQWQTLAEQVGGAEAGSRECFLGFQALTAHGSAARAFLGRLRGDDDGSGTGQGGYPLTAGGFETLLRRLPEQDVAPWARGMRAELQAGQRLAAGLRALSERRNLAAAGHLEKLLADHPHAFVVAVLP